MGNPGPSRVADDFFGNNVKIVPLGSLERRMLHARITHTHNHETLVDAGASENIGDHYCSGDVLD